MLEPTNISFILVIISLLFSNKTESVNQFKFPITEPFILQNSESVKGLIREKKEMTLTQRGQRELDAYI